MPWSHPVEHGKERVGQHLGTHITPFDPEFRVLITYRPKKSIFYNLVRVKVLVYAIPSTDMLFPFCSERIYSADII